MAHPYSLPPGNVKGSDKAALRALASKSLAPALQRLVEATEEPFIQAIMDLQVPQMVFGRTVLLGDAAFVPRPHTGGSTSKAASDAVSLARVLSNTSLEIDQALLAWQSTQMSQGRNLTERGIATGNQIMGMQETRK